MAVVQGKYVAEDFIMKVAFVAICIVVWVDINPLATILPPPRLNPVRQNT